MINSYITGYFTATDKGHSSIDFSIDDRMIGFFYDFDSISDCEPYFSSIKRERGRSYYLPGGDNSRLSTIEALRVPVVSSHVENPFLGDHIAFIFLGPFDD